MVSSLKAKWRKISQNKGLAIVRFLKDKIRKNRDWTPRGLDDRRTMQGLARCALREFDDQEYGRCIEMLSIWPRGRKALKHMLRLRPGIASASEGRTRGALLHYAVPGRLDFVVALLEAGADPNARSKWLDWTPLFHATVENVKHGASVVTSLLEHGADPNAKDAKGNTPLHQAAQVNNVAICKLLIAAGSDVNAKDNEDFAPLEFAVDHKFPKCIETLLAAGAELTSDVVEAAMCEGSPRGLHLLFRAEPCCVHWAFYSIDRDALCINVEYLNRIRKAAVDAQFFVRPGETASEDRDRFARSVDALITSEPQISKHRKRCAECGKLVSRGACRFAAYEAYERDQRRGLATIVRRHVVGHRVPAEIGDIIVEYWGHPGGYVVF